MGLCGTCNTLKYLKKEKAPVAIRLQGFSVVPVVGVEPTRYRYHGILSPARLPIPSHRRVVCSFIIIADATKKSKTSAATFSYLTAAANTGPYFLEWLRQQTEGHKGPLFGCFGLFQNCAIPNIVKHFLGQNSIFNKPNSIEALGIAVIL